jgi:V-type H+-transporting ATPase subunit E
MEEKVTVSCKSTDVQIVQGAAKDAEAAYKEKSGRETTVEVKEDLSKEYQGGVILAGHGGRIKINQTLDERLRLLEDRMLPEIRMELFGPNENRKFYN